MRARKAKNIEGLDEQKRQLHRDRELLANQIERVINDMRDEKEGKRASARPGAGAVYLELQAQRDRLKAEASALDARIGALDQAIDAQSGTGRDEFEVEGGFEAIAPVPEAFATVKLTAQEEAEQLHLQHEIESYSATLAAVRAQQQQIRTEAAELPQKFSLANRSDALAQTRVLIELAIEDRGVFLHVLVLALLFLCVDMVPAILKLTVKTGYDDYLKSLARQRTIASERARTRYDRSVMQSARARLQSLSDYTDEALQRLENYKISPEDSRQMRAVKRATADELQRSVPEAIASMRNGQSEQRAAPHWEAWFSTLRSAWHVLRARLGV